MSDTPQPAAVSEHPASCWRHRSMLNSPVFACSRLAARRAAGPSLERPAALTAPLAPLPTRKAQPKTQTPCHALHGGWACSCRDATPGLQLVFELGQLAPKSLW